MTDLTERALSEWIAAPVSEEATRTQLQRVGSRLLAYRMALGKILLAFLPDASQRELIARMEPVKRGPNTVASKRALSGELAQVREDGVAFSDEELAPGLISIAAPIRDESREVLAAINVVAHTDMISLAELADISWRTCLRRPTRSLPAWATGGMTRRCDSDVPAAKCVKNMTLLIIRMIL